MKKWNFIPPVPTSNSHLSSITLPTSKRTKKKNKKNDNPLITLCHIMLGRLTETTLFLFKICHTIIHVPLYCLDRNGY